MYQSCHAQRRLACPPTIQLPPFLSLHCPQVTSPYYYKDIGGFSYILAVSQHPYEGRDDKVKEPLSSGIDATVGYFHWKTSGEWPLAVGVCGSWGGGRWRDGALGWWWRRGGVGAF